jgi:type IV pilus assembly protein PilM
MFAAKKPNSIVGLDIETGSIAATEVQSNGTHDVARTAIAALEPGVVAEGEVQDGAALSEALKTAFSRHRLGKTVRLGVANQRVVVRTLRLPLIEDADELDTAIRFQAQDQIPMPLDQAVLDHHVVSRETGPEGERQMEVIAVAARRDMVASLLGALRDAGLRPVGIDLSAFGMIRALSSGQAPRAEGEPALTTLYCYLGDITNLAVARGSECLFTRVLEATGSSREAVDGGGSKLVDELRLSLEYYSAQEGVPPIERVIVCGPGSTIQGLPEEIQAGLGLGIEALTPRALEHLDEKDAARLTVSYGLALG